MFKLWIPIEVKSRQEATRVVPVKRKLNTGETRVVHMPVKSRKLNANQQAIETYIHVAGPHGTIVVPCRVRLVFVTPYCRYHLKGNWNRNDLMPKATRPELDNLMKGFIDCLVRCQVIKDDNLIVTVSASKYYGMVGGVLCIIDHPYDHETVNDRWDVYECQAKQAR